MLERVTLEQRRLNVPGIAPDSRGVMLGQRGMLLLPTIERVVSFFRVYSNQDSLDDLLPTLKIEQVETPLGTREFLVSFAAASSYQMDRCASIAKMLGGLAFTGTSRHFVKYRDATSPLGYDTDRLLPTGGDVALYHDDFSQTYQVEREISFRQLLLQLTPHRTRPSPAGGLDEVLLAVRPGLAGAVQGYLYRNGVKAAQGIAEWPAASAFDEGPRRLFVFRCVTPPARIVDLMDATPGVEVYEPLGSTVAVQRGYEHPVHLPSCLSVFEDGRHYLFCGERKVVEILSPAPDFVDIRHLSSISVELGEAERGRAGRTARGKGKIQVPLRLVPQTGPPARIRAASIGWDKAAWLQRLLYMLPPQMFEDIQVHLSPERIFLVGEEGLERIPLGRLLYKYGEAIFVAAGYGFLPHVAPELLREVLELERGELVVFEPGERGPYIIEEATLRPLGRLTLSALPPERMASLEVEETTVPQPVFEYDNLGPFPLWGLPGSDEGEGSS